MNLTFDDDCSSTSLVYIKVTYDIMNYFINFSFEIIYINVLQVVNEMASAAGLECAVDPALAAALRNQKTGK